MRWSETAQELFKGVLYGLGAILGAAVALYGLLSGSISVAHPSADLFQMLAEIGVGLLIAYSVAVAGVERQLRHDKEHEFWVGFTSGVGFAALLALALSIGLTAYRDAGHSSVLDIAGLCWTIVSFGLLGILIAALPLAAYSWRRAAERQD